MTEIMTIGLDLAKTVFQVHGADGEGQAALRKRLRRRQVVGFFASVPPCLVGLEACSGAHYWARELMDLGHEAQQISPQFVKPYVKTNKSDLNDAEAICEAASRPSMRFVAIKLGEQLSIQASHRIRSRLVGNRTSLVNQIRGILAEFGIVVARNLAALRRCLPEVLGSDMATLDPLTSLSFWTFRTSLLSLTTGSVSTNAGSSSSAKPVKYADSSNASRGSDP